MRVDVTPSRIELQPGVPHEVLVTLTNPGTVIAGYKLRILGVDPGWVELDGDDGDLSLFPSESRTVLARITVPPGLVAGERRMAVQVRELTPPFNSEVAEVALVVPEARQLRLVVDPVTVTAGRKGRFSLLVDNTGNTPLRGLFAAADAEARLRYRFDPPLLDLVPGEHAVVNLEASGRRPFSGSPAVRIVELHLTDASSPGGAEVARAPRGRRGRGAAAPPDVAGTPVLANATLVQKAVLSRGSLSLFGLLAAITVFAIVITVAMSRIVDQSTADRELALKIAAAGDGGGGNGSGRSVIEGTVRTLTDGSPAENVVVNVYAADDVATPLLNDATGPDGTYSFAGLPAGDYKLTFRGAGFVTTWFPQALDPDNAEVVKVEDNGTLQGLDVAIGGVPATISGTVVGDDVTEASITLRTPTTATSTAGSAGTSGVVLSSPDGPGAGATVLTTPVGADGAFSLADVPSPAVYEIVVTKAGYAPSVQPIDVRAGEARKGVEIQLVKGNGIIAGRVVSDGEPLGDVTVTATSGQTTVSTLTLTDGDPGSFTLRRLATPGTYNLVAVRDGYASQTLSVTLADAQELTGVTLTLGKAASSLSGRAIFTNGQPAPGVTVSVTDGQQTVQTATGSADDDLGRWSVSGLPVPGTYTVTLSRSDLEPQTMSVTLDANGVVTSGSSGVSELTTVLRSSTAVLHGTVSQPGEPVPPATTGVLGPVGEVTVTLSTGGRTYSVVTASTPDKLRGQYRIEGIAPGTYTVSIGRSGVRPTSEIITLSAGQELDYDVGLDDPAQIAGLVREQGSTTGVGPGYVVELFRATDYPGVVYRTVKTDPDGSYLFFDLDAPETYVVQVRRTAGSTPLGTKNVALSASESEQADVILR